MCLQVALRDILHRLFEVKHFQTIRHCNVDVAHGLALLFGIGTRALPSWDPRTRWNNLTGGLALPLAGPSDRADSPHPSSREGHHSTAGWSSSFLLSELICQDCHASLIGRLRSSTFRLSATAMSMSLTGSRFSSESAPGPFHHGIRGRGGTI